MRVLSIAITGAVLWAATAWAGPLHDVSRNGDLKAAADLLDHGADLAEPDSAGEPPLLLAALAGRADLVTLYLERGADIKARNKGGLTALHAAAYGGNLAVVKLLVEKGAAIDDANNFYKMTPLHAAAEEGHAAIVAFLLASGANKEAKERNGITPLSQAGWREYWDAADILLKAGAVCQDATIVGAWLNTECTKRK